jgi:hypothetical protein
MSHILKYYAELEGAGVADLMALAWLTPGTKRVRLRWQIVCYCGKTLFPGYDFGYTLSPGDFVMLKLGSITVTVAVLGLWRLAQRRVFR